MVNRFSDNTFCVWIQITANALLSWLLFPFILSPNTAYPFSRLIEVLFWQVVAFFGWPLAVFGIVLGIPFGLRITNIYSALPILVYPAMQVLLFLTIKTKTHRRAKLFFLHILIIISFGVVWYSVFEGYSLVNG